MKNENRSSLEVYREERLKDPKFRKIYEEESRKVRLGFAINQLRTAAHLTQAQLAQKIGVSQAYIAKLETAELDNYELVTLRKVAAALKQDLIVTLRARGKARGAKEFVIAA